MSFKSSAYVLVVVDTVRSFEISCNRTLTEYWEISTCLSSHLLYISNRFNIDLNRLLVCFLTLEVHLRETYSEVGRGGPVLFNVLSLTLTLSVHHPYLVVSLNFILILVENWFLYLDIMFEFCHELNIVLPHQKIMLES